jgi:hypothetical protein
VEQAGLTPVQHETLGRLRRSGDAVRFDPDLIAELRVEMRGSLDHFAERLHHVTDERGEATPELFVSKHRIATVLDCEEHFLATRDGFAWSTANAKGTIAHRAIQLLLSWRGEPTPLDLVDEAMARLVDEERGIGTWLAGLSPADEADVRGQTAQRVTQFLEGFPPLRKEWHPMTEAPVRWPNDGPIVLSGKVDLVFGRPVGDEARKVIIDLKTGRPNVRHRQDLGFYALLETLVRGVPPRKVATFYLDAGSTEAEDVSERLLRSAVRRTLDGINALVQLEVERRDPVRRPGVTCRWCPLVESCDDGRTWLADGGTPGVTAGV